MTMTTTEHLALFETAQEVVGFPMAARSALIRDERESPHPTRS